MRRTAAARVDELGEHRAAAAVAGSLTPSAAAAAAREAEDAVRSLFLLKQETGCSRSRVCNYVLAADGQEGGGGEEGRTFTRSRFPHAHRGRHARTHRSAMRREVYQSVAGARRRQSSPAAPIPPSVLPLLLFPRSFSRVFAFQHSTLSSSVLPSTICVH